LYSIDVISDVIQKLCGEFLDKTKTFLKNVMELLDIKFNDDVFTKFILQIEERVNLQEILENTKTVLFTDDMFRYNINEEDKNNISKNKNSNDKNILNYITLVNDELNNYINNIITAMDNLHNLDDKDKPTEIENILSIFLNKINTSKFDKKQNGF
jgi:hypothetical protein